MNLEQMRNRVAAILALLTDLNAKADLTDEDVKSVDELNTEFEDLSAKISAREKIEKATAAAAAAIPRKTTTPAASTASVTDVADRILQDPKRGFKNYGGFLIEAHKAGKNPHHTPMKAAGLSERFAEDGGFLVPEDFRQEMQTKITGDESLLSRCSQFLTAKNTLTMPVNETAPWDSSAGIQAYWEGEDTAHTASKGKFGELSMKLHKLSALVPVTEELLEDAPLIESWITNNAPQAMLQKVNTAIISGGGVGMPLGFLNSGFKVKVSKVSMQTADTIRFENVNDMIGRMVPGSLGNAVWLVNPLALPQLRTMVILTGSATSTPVFLPATGVSSAPYGTLYGIPFLPMMGGVKALGDEGDICLVDLKYYFAALKAAANGNNLGVKAAVSTHLYFDTDKVAFKFTMRMAGQVPYKSAITNQAGDFTGSGIITLEDR